MWLSASDTSDGRWPLQDAPQPAMARILRASCLLSLLLAGFVPPGRGQEKSKVSEPPGLKRSPLHPGAHRATGRATASPEALGTPLVTLGLCALPTQTRVFQRAGSTNPGGQSFPSSYILLHCHLGFALPHPNTWDPLSHSAGLGERVGVLPPPTPPALRRVKLMVTLLKNCWGRDGERADSLFTHSWGLEAEICDRNFDLETHPFLGLSFSISRA